MTAARASQARSALPAPRESGTTSPADPGLPSQPLSGITEEQRHRILVDNCVDALFHTVAGVLEYVSPAIRTMTGWAPEELAGRPTTHLWHPDDLAAAVALRDRVYAGSTGEAVLRLRRRDDSFMWVEVRMRPLRQPDGRVGGVGSIRDVDDRIAVQQALAEAEAHYRTLAELTTDVVLRWGPDMVTSWVSPSVREVLGWAPEDLVGRTPDDLVHPDDRATARRLREQVRAGDPIPERAELRFATGAGQWRWGSATARTIRDGTRLVGGVTWIRDIHREHEARASLARSEERSRQALHSAPVCTAVVGFDRRFLQVNPALCRLLGRPAAWLLEHQVPDVLDADSNGADLEQRLAALGGGSAQAAGEVVLMAADGRRIVAEHSVAVLRDDHGNPVSFVSQFVDVTEDRQDRAELEFLATHDPLTGLANRRALLAQLRATLDAAPAAPPPRLAVLFCDLDGLKDINDRHGHAVGDVVLVQVAHRISRAVGPRGSVARLAGDEFVVLVPGCQDPPEAAALARQVHRDVARPVRTAGGVLVPTVSIGIALACPGEAPETLLARADADLYSVKGTQTSPGEVP